jgi:aromatic ring-opening dioxygenase LigB subunit
VSLHTATYKGKRVRIVLLDGTIIIGKFVERTRNKWVVLTDRRIHAREIRAFSDYRRQEAHGTR